MMKISEDVLRFVHSLPTEHAEELMAGAEVETLEQLALHAQTMKDSGAHIHKCDNCQTLWGHNDPPPDFLLPLYYATPEEFNTEYTHNHLCPNCGTDQRQKFGGWAKYVI